MILIVLYDVYLIVFWGEKIGMKVFCLVRVMAGMGALSFLCSTAVLQLLRRVEIGKSWEIESLWSN